MACPGSFLLVVMCVFLYPPPTPSPYYPQNCHCLRCQQRLTGRTRWVQSPMLLQIEFWVTIPQRISLATWTIPSIFCRALSWVSSTDVHWGERMPSGSWRSTLRCSPTIRAPRSSWRGFQTINSTASSGQFRQKKTTPSEAAPCPLQPCYFAKWDIFADTSDCQYAMGFPVCILDNFLRILPISCHLLMSEWDSPIFEKLFFPKNWILCLI